MRRATGCALIIGLSLFAGSAWADKQSKEAATKDAAINDAVSKEAEAARADVKTTFGFVPEFIRRTPDVALPSAWHEMKSLQMDPKTRLSNKSKELIGLAVAAQIPCAYCIVAHTEFAKLNGATDTEIGEAVALAGVTRNFSTFLNGIQPDEGQLRAEVVTWVAHIKEMMASGATPTAIDVVDAPSALADVKQTFGSVPDFIKRFPAAGLVGFWRSFKDIEMATTTLDEKTKSLIGVAVAAQIPCRYCIIVDTQFAKMHGTTEAEIAEAVAVSGHVRNWSTLLNGMQMNTAAFKRDVARIVAASKKMEQAKEAEIKKTAARNGRAKGSSR